MSESNPTAAPLGVDGWQSIQFDTGTAYGMKPRRHDPVFRLSS